MDWIKRNLFFVIGAGVAVLLLAVAGYYTWTSWAQYTEQREKLNQAYSDLKGLIENPFVGGGSGAGKVDNTKLAAEQRQQIRDFLKKADQRFQPIRPIPDTALVTRDEYASQLRLTIDQLQRDATNNSVVLLKGYNYSFDAQRRLPQPAPGSLPLLAAQLGEVKAICEILHQAKINYLDAVRRERVSTDDEAGPQTDYIAVKSQTNELAVLTPYELSFRCFTPELGAVVAGFANSPHGFIVKNINVEPAAAQTTDTPMMMPPMYYQPPPTPSPQQPFPRGGAEGLEGRYGGKGGFAPPPPPPTQYPVAPVAQQPKGLQILVNEKQLKVTMLIHVVKLLPPKQST